MSRTTDRLDKIEGDVRYIKGQIDRISMAVYEKAQTVPINLGMLHASMGRWVDVPGTDLQARIIATDSPDRFYLRGKPKDEPCRCHS